MHRPPEESKLGLEPALSCKKRLRLVLKDAAFRADAYLGT